MIAGIAKPEPLFDVVIYCYETGIIDSIIGQDMTRNTGYYNAERRLETGLSQVNDRYGVEIVPAGKFKKGDKL